MGLSRAGPRVIELSLNEVTALARKAARGGGFDWASAEEAGRAVRWLTARGQDGAAALLLRLGLDTVPPRLDGDHLTGDGPLCPIRAGLALADLAALPGWSGLRLRDVTAPILVLPFAALAAKATGRNLRLRGAGEGVTDGTTMALDGNWTGTTDLDITPVARPVAPQPLTARAHVSLETLDALTAFAHRTYAPATETSRLRGAGAGQSDND